ncbi:amyloid fiber anchoring/assembly protein TapA [Bacillus mangrovi]|uniref:Amyloid fiber anchoring/assembly protein TapA n=1 Tax=Metabacillus mangrovi TaxID=1491830 RepID=A0A7X2S372_9BACI|nr:amyloid fiber anchoring/assembly protein TapA [Metabacillus mangrovi]MTH52391.1 amyloid fiber anchoring/assembly protein TapA [Metabacillus mangrovi]
MKNKIVLKTAVLFYALLLLLSFSSSSTEAYFNVQQDQNIGIQAGSWWDESRLAFTDFPEQKDLTNCHPLQLQFPIENQGFTMAGTTSYRIYLDGAVAEEGTLGIVRENQSSAIAFTANEPGIYTAEIDQRPGFGWKDEAVTSIRSKDVSVAKCPPPPAEKENTEKTVDEKTEVPDQQEPAEANPSEPEAETELEIPVKGKDDVSSEQDQEEPADETREER